MILRLGENGTTAPRPGVGLVWLKRTGRALAGKARTARHELRAVANDNRASQSPEANGLREASRTLQQWHLALANV